MPVEQPGSGATFTEKITVLELLIDVNTEHLMDLERLIEKLERAYKE